MNGVSEIVEVDEEDFEAHQTGLVNKRYMLKQKHKQKHVFGLEEDIDRLFQALDVGTSLGAKSRMKRPMRASTSNAPGIGMPESPNLKQALRGLCILQASEMAALKKRSLKPTNPPVAGVNTKTVVYTGEPDSPLPGPGRGGQVVKKVSLPDKVVPRRLSQDLPISTELPQQRRPSESKHSSIASLVSPRMGRLGRAPTPEKVVPLSSEASYKLSNTEFQLKGKKKATKNTKGGSHTLRQELEKDDAVPSNVSRIVGLNEQQENCNGDMVKGSNDSCNKIQSETCPCSTISDKLKTSRTNSPRLAMLALRNKNFVKRQAKVESPLASSVSSPSARKGNVDPHHGTNELVGPAVNRQGQGSKEACCSSPSVADASSRVGTDVMDSGDSKISRGADDVADASKVMRLKEKGEISQSSKSSSIGEYSSTTNNSGESSSLSDSSTNCMNRPHMSKDLKWEAIQSCVAHNGKLSLRNFKLLRRLGSGDIGTVYLAQLIGTDSLFALKVMDSEFLSRRKKLLRAQTEREILQMLDHPFLPTLYCHFTTDKLSCLVMEYCPGGDLHVLRQKQTLRSFSEQAVRFYIAEVLLALEYLHMLGVVYRDLKPENVLVREDGHIMLSDFDLSLRCIVIPTVTRSTSHNRDARKKVHSPCNGSNCINPFCLQPSWEATSCFSPRLLTSSSKTRKVKSEPVSDFPFPQLIVEPTDARSNSFVGTHEYLAPEIIKGDGHGSAVDWWTFGIFLFELLYGKTPFKGSTNEETVANVISKPLKFPDATIVSFYARDLIRGLLVKEPENRMGFIKGAAEVKQHPFFEGLNWALIRCAVPPERPNMEDSGIFSDRKEAGEESTECESGEGLEFELF